MDAVNAVGTSALMVNVVQMYIAAAHGMTLLVVIPITFSANMQMMSQQKHVTSKMETFVTSLCLNPRRCLMHRLIAVP
jgi:hypothetical protein